MSSSNPAAAAPGGVSDALSGLTSGASSVANNLSDSLQNVKQSVNNTVADFSSRSMVDAGNEFVQSNSIVAKVVFVILVMIVFSLMLRLGTVLISLFLSDKNPYLISGLIKGNEAIEITQDPSGTNGFIQNSVDQPSGAEFTYSVWCSFSDASTAISHDDYLVQRNHIFNKGTKDKNATTNVMTTNNAPGLYVAKGNGQLFLYVYMDIMSTNKSSTITQATQDATGKGGAYDSSGKQDNRVEVRLDGIPFNKWVNIMIRLQNRVLDVYVNGTLAKRADLGAAPKLNADSVFVCQNGGYDGELSDLRYFNYAMNVFEINKTVALGPNLSPSKISSMQSKVPSNFHYLGNTWYNYQS